MTTDVGQIFGTEERFNRLWPIAERFDDQDRRTLDMIEAADEQATRYLGGGSAPASVLREAIVRMVGYLRDAPAPNVSQETLGPTSFSYATGQLSALRHSGAMALLSPYKRRGGAIARGAVE